MRIFLVTILLLLASCEEEQAPVFPSDAKPTTGYDAYVFACTTDGEIEEVCICHADILSRKLNDEQIYILAEAGRAALEGNAEVIDNVIQNHPEILLAMKNLSIDAEICLVAAQTELENLIE